MTDFMETEDRRAIIKQKLRQNFDGKIVRKDLTKKIKEGANVPVYVLEFLLGQYCSSDRYRLVRRNVPYIDECRRRRYGCYAGCMQDRRIRL